MSVANVSRRFMPVRRGEVRGCDSEPWFFAITSTWVAQGKAMRTAVTLEDDALEAEAVEALPTGRRCIDDGVVAQRRRHSVAGTPTSLSGLRTA